MTSAMMLILAMIFCCFTQPSVTSAAQSPANIKQNSYLILGAVTKPGSYQIEGPASVLKLIALAGGLSELHSGTAFIIRRDTPQADPANPDVVPGNVYKVIRIDISGILKGESQNDVALTSGDILNISATDGFVPTGSQPGNTPPLLDAPPIRDPAPCRGARPCMALKR